MPGDSRFAYYVNPHAYAAPQDQQIRRYVRAHNRRRPPHQHIHFYGPWRSLVQHIGFRSSLFQESTTLNSQFHYAPDFIDEVPLSCDHSRRRFQEIQGVPLQVPPAAAARERDDPSPWGTLTFTVEH
jgi:hypothetical protein